MLALAWTIVPSIESRRAFSERRSVLPPPQQKQKLPPLIRETLRRTFTARTCKSTPESSGTLFTKGKMDVPPGSDQNLKSALMLLREGHNVPFGPTTVESNEGTGSPTAGLCNCATSKGDNADFFFPVHCFALSTLSTALLRFFFTLSLFHPSIPFFPFNSSSFTYYFFLLFFSLTLPPPPLTCPHPT